MDADDDCGPHIQASLRAARQVNAALHAQLETLQQRVASLERSSGATPHGDACAEPGRPGQADTADSAFLALESLRLAASHGGWLEPQPSQAVVLGERLGAGAWGEARLCCWRGAACVVKAVRGPPRAMADAAAEAATLARLRHPHVLPLLAVALPEATTGSPQDADPDSEQPPALWILSELMPGGSLKAWLAAEPRPLAQRLRCGLDIALGMRYLHERSTPLLHRDLKPSNVLLDGCGRCRVADFGLARSLPPGEQVSARMTGETGTYLYMAPEVMRHEAYGPPADVFSFGVMLVEMLAGHRPYAERPELKPAEIALRVSAGSLPPSALPPGTPPALAALAGAATAHDAAGRPPFSEVAAALQARGGGGGGGSSSERSAASR